MNLWFPLARRRLGLDAIHYPAFPAPLFQQNGMVASIHDVTALRYPETMTFVGRHYWRPLLVHAARVARPVLTGSNSTGADLIALAGADPARIVVTPYAADAAFTQQPAPDVLAAIRARYRLPERFVLAVGTLEPRKNLGTLFAALQRLRRALADPPTLVVVGREGWGPAAAVEQLRSLGDAVRFTGHIGDEALIALYHLAAVFVYPSLYEGFGFPILEAFAAGCPVVTTEVSSLPEVAGDAALLVEPLDATALAEAVARLWRDDVLAGRLRAAGRARARQFTWERCAELTAAAYHMAR